MTALSRISALLSIAPLVSFIISDPSIFPRFFSNSIILLLLLICVWPIFTAQHHALHHVSLASVMLAPFLTVFYKILTLVSPVLVPTLLSNFTFAAIVITLFTFVMLVSAGFLAGVFLAASASVTGFSAGYLVMRYRVRDVTPEEEPSTLNQVRDEVASTIDRWCADFDTLIEAYVSFTTTHITAAITMTSVRYVMLSYYTVLLPPLLNTDASAMLLPTDILVYGITVSLGIHATFDMIFLLLPGNLHNMAGNQRLSLTCVLKSISDVYWCVIMTLLIAVPFAERELLGGSVSMFWAFVKSVMLDALYGWCISRLSEARFDDQPNWLKTGCVTGVGFMWVRCGSYVWEGVNELKFGLTAASRNALM